jgi:hypothetical protein
LADATFDTREFDMRMNLYDKKQREAGGSALYLAGLDLEKEAKFLVAKDKGDLEGDINTQRPRRTGALGSVLEVLVGANKPYAAKVHETMSPAPGAIMQPGPLTRAKPPTRFGPAGGKYLSRPLLGKMKEYAAQIAKAIKVVR